MRADCGLVDLCQAIHQEVFRRQIGSKKCSIRNTFLVLANGVWSHALWWRLRLFLSSIRANPAWADAAFAAGEILSSLLSSGTSIPAGQVSSEPVVRRAIYPSKPCDLFEFVVNDLLRLGGEVVVVIEFAELERVLGEE